MSTIQHVTASDWEALAKASKPTFIDFWAEWCGPCRMLGPTFERLAEKYGNEIDFAKINVDELPEVAGELGIRAVPTLLLMKDGQVIEQVVGTRSFQDLAAMLERHVPVAKN
jgi:thioredoxin